MGIDKYILAMYDIRGKQDFIYRCNRIKEIVGGSYIIRDCFDDCLFPAAEAVFGEEQKKVGKYIKERGSLVTEENIRLMSRMILPWNILKSVWKKVISGK